MPTPLDAMLTELYIIRHAHPRQDTGLLYDRVPGPPLSEIGQEEARSAGLYLSQCRLEQLFVSPLDRTQETARAIAEITQTPMEIVDDLAEQRSDESFDRVRARVQAMLNRAEAGPWARVGFVTHGSPTKALLQLLSGNTLDLTRFVFDNGNHVPTAGIWRAERRVEGQAAHDEQGWQLELVFTPAMVRTH